MSQPPHLVRQGVSAITQWRDRKRSPEAIKSLELARELKSLAVTHPRFAARLLSLQLYVKQQAGRPHTKRRRILQCLKESPWPLLDLGEIMGDTNLDRVSCTEGLGVLVRRNQVDEVNRDGDPPRKTKSGRPTDHVYYRWRRPVKTNLTKGQVKE